VRLEMACEHRFPSGFALRASWSTTSLVTALFGPSGSGKTSLLQILAGLLRPQSARIALGNRTLADLGQGIWMSAPERRVGYVLQEPLLFPHLNVAENLRYGFQRRQGRDGVSWAQVLEILELGPLLNRLPPNLSGGEKQRVALGRALLRGPELLLLDEPWSGLDAARKSRLFKSFEKILRTWRIPTVLVSHDLVEVQRLAQHVVLIQAGRVVGQGSPAETLLPHELGVASAALVRATAGSGPWNLLKVEELRFQDDRWLGRVGQHWWHLPPCEESLQPPVYVQFATGDVVLSRHADPGLSIRNQLAGEVRQVVAQAGAVFVAVDVGAVLWAEITSQAAHELALAPGQPVFCLLKTQALRVQGS